MKAIPHYNASGALVGWTDSKFVMPKTKRGAQRQYDSIMRQCRRDLSGGLAYGMDWPTLRATFPERYSHLSAMNAVYAQLPA